MIALIGNRPVLQIGSHQVSDYDTEWVARALQRAAAAADHPDFPFLEEIRRGIDEYLDTKCSLQLLPLPALFERIRRMLETIGCDRIAAALRPVAPPVTLSLARAARQAGTGYELAFFEQLRRELDELRRAGAEEIRFTDLRESIQLLRGRDDWDGACDRLLTEVRHFLEAHDRELRLHIRDAARSTPVLP